MLVAMATESITRIKCTCDDCGRDWVSRLDRPPKQCTFCQSRVWNTGGVKNRKAEDVKAREAVSRERYLGRKRAKE